MNEKRRFGRFEVDLPGTYCEDGTTENHPCRIVEVSLQGLRFKVTEKIRSGRKIEIRCERPGAQPVTIKLVVRWAKQLYDESALDYLTGGETVTAESDAAELLLECGNISG